MSPPSEPAKKEVAPLLQAISVVAGLPAGRLKISSGCGGNARWLWNHQVEKFMALRGATGRLSYEKVCAVTLNPHMDGCHMAKGNGLD